MCSLWDMDFVCSNTVNLRGDTLVLYSPDVGLTEANYEFAHGLLTSQLCIHSQQMHTFRKDTKSPCELVTFPIQSQPRMVLYLWEQVEIGVVYFILSLSI